MENQKKSGLATAGLVLGIIGILFSFIPIINNLAFFMGILALIFGIICLIKKASKTTAIVAIVLAILSMYFTIKSQQAISDALQEVSQNLDTATGNNTETVLNNYFDVIIGIFEVKQGEYGLSDTQLLVTIKNKSNEQKSGNIQIEAVNSEGNRIDTDTIYINNLNAGQSQEFKAFNFVSSDKIEQLKNAEFKILEASAY